MTRNHHTSVLSTFKEGKDKKFKAQFERVLLELRKAPQTMLQVSISTGILRANICRYIASMQATNQVGVFKRDLCPVSKFPANFYTTDPDLLPSDSQTNLFDEG